MRETARTDREREIEETALALVEERGYAGTSMLAIARRARASNETLYNWYGDKEGLFRALVRRNATTVRELLEQHLADDRDPLETLLLVGAPLLELLTGPRAIALNRAAAGDPTLALGAALAQAGRETVAPLIGRVMVAARSAGRLHFEDEREAVELHLALLIGDLQIRRVIGAIEPLSPKERRERARRAHERTLVLLGPPPGTG